MAEGASHHPLQPEYEKFLAADLAEALVRQYVRLKQRAWRDDHEGVQESGGKVAEHALRAAQHLGKMAVTGMRQEIRDMPSELKKLEQLPRTQADDAVRVVLPRVIGALYTLRNKRSGGHTAAEVDPSRADAALTERMADWLMAEFFRIGNKLPLDQAEAAVTALVERRIPAVYKLGGYRRVLRTGLTGPAELQRWSGIPRTTLSRYVDQLERERLVRTQNAGGSRRAFLLPPGERRVERERWLEPEQ